MGASVGVGGLIIGISMLVVFSMAYQAISLQIESGVDRIEEADEPAPSFTIDDAVIFTGAVVDVTIGNGGAGYSSGGTIEASSGTGGFSATYAINNVTGAITSVVITSHGNYSALPTLVVNGGGTPTSTASFTPTLGNVVYANLTNTGSTTIAHDDAWLFLDGQDATLFSTVYNPPLTNLWFSGETLFLDWFNTGLPGDERLTLTVGETTVSHGLW